MKRSYAKRATRRPRRSIKRRTFARRVRSVVQRTMETKTVSTTSEEASLISPLTEARRETNIFQISQGPLANQRIGNQVNGIGMSVRMIMKNNSASNMFVRCFVLELMDSDTTSPLDAIIIRGGTGQAMTGTLSDIHFPLNRRQYRVKYDRTYLIAYSGGDLPVAFRKFYIPYRHTLSYDNSSTTNQPRRRLGIFWIARRADADESTGDTVELSYDIDFNFKDA